jgi:hypothetical protein
MCERSFVKIVRDSVNFSCVSRRGRCAHHESKLCDRFKDVVKFVRCIVGSSLCFGVTRVQYSR